MGDEFFEVLNGYAASGAAAGQAGEVGGVQAEFHHAGFHARRHITGAGRVRRHGQPADRRLHALARRLGLQLGGGAGAGFRSFPVFLRRWGIETEACGVLFAGFEVTEHRADRVALIKFDQELFHPAREGWKSSWSNLMRATLSARCSVTSKPAKRTPHASVSMPQRRKKTGKERKPAPAPPPSCKPRRRVSACSRRSAGCPCRRTRPAPVICRRA